MVLEVRLVVEEHEILMMVEVYDELVWIWIDPNEVEKEQVVVEREYDDQVVVQIIVEVKVI